MELMQIDTEHPGIDLGMDGHLWKKDWYIDLYLCEKQEFR